ncbi:hypothetical protein Ancab_000168 [Ancistrocladus abbreviatus]
MEGKSKKIRDCKSVKIGGKGKKVKLQISKDVKGVKLGKRGRRANVTRRRSTRKPKPIITISILYDALVINNKGERRKFGDGKYKKAIEGSSGKKKRALLLSIFWKNGLGSPRKPNDGRAMHFKRRKLLDARKQCTTSLDEAMDNAGNEVAQGFPKVAPEEIDHLREKVLQSVIRLVSKSGLCMEDDCLPATEDSMSGCIHNDTNDLKANQQAESAENLVLEGNQFEPRGGHLTSLSEMGCRPCTSDGNMTDMKN